MQTISTKYYGPTNTKGSRIKATTSSGITKWFSYDYGLEGKENHIEAARALKDALYWTGDMIGGDTKDGLVFVFSDNAPTIKCHY